MAMMRSCAARPALRRKDHSASPRRGAAASGDHDYTAGKEGGARSSRAGLQFAEGIEFLEHRRYPKVAIARCRDGGPATAPLSPEPTRRLGSVPRSARHRRTAITAPAAVFLFCPFSWARDVPSLEL